MGFTYDNIETNITYDTEGRKTQVTDAAGNVTRYEYNGAGCGCTGAASGAMTYDALGRKLTETVNYGLFSKGYSYGYDAHGNKATYTDPAGVVYGYGFTGLHQPSGIAWSGGSIAYTYQWNRLVSQSLPNGVATGYTYNDNGWLTGIAVNASTSGTVMDYSYQFDSVGNITGRTTEAGAYAYNYDDLYRLTDATRPALAAETFGYDKVGNRLSSADYADWSYNNNNALIGYDGVSYTYDANGNTETKSLSGQLTRFTYSAKDRLEQVNLPDGSIAVYMYDPFGRRISKTVGGETTYFMYSDEGLAAEIDVSGNVTRTYGWKPNGTWGTNPVMMTEGGNTYFCHNDHLGTPQKMTGIDGTVVWSATYTAFGEAAVDAASTVTNNLRFPGQYFDAETGLHYNLHRYYDPKTGRYITEDPMGLAEGVNLFVYVKNKPVNWTDPLGLCNCKDACPSGVYHYEGIDYGGFLFLVGVHTMHLRFTCIGKSSESFSATFTSVSVGAGLGGGAGTSAGLAAGCNRGDAINSITGFGGSATAYGSAGVGFGASSNWSSSGKAAGYSFGYGAEISGGGSYTFRR